MNVAMVGAVSGYLPISKDILIESFKALVSQKTIEVNLGLLRWAGERRKKAKR
jgi:indolepyruvate ferredoxin oxidoreductase beta subunit